MFDDTCAVRISIGRPVDFLDQISACGRQYHQQATGEGYNTQEHFSGRALHLPAHTRTHTGISLDPATYGYMQLTTTGNSGVWEKLGGGGRDPNRTLILLSS